MAVIAIDFDRTIVDDQYEPLEGAKKAINAFREAGHKVIIHSCNNPKWIEKVLTDHDIRFDDIWADQKGKPMADLYVDDRGYRFNGNWNVESDEILQHEHIENKDTRKW